MKPATLVEWYRNHIDNEGKVFVDSRDLAAAMMKPDVTPGDHEILRELYVALGENILGRVPAPETLRKEV